MFVIEKIKDLLIMEIIVGVKMVIVDTIQLTLPLAKNVLLIVKYVLSH